MKLEDFTITALVSIAIVTSFFLLIADVAATYGLDTSDQFDSNTTRAALDQIKSIQEEMHKTVVSSDGTDQPTEQTNDPDKNNVGFWAFTKATFKAIYLNARLIGPTLTLITGIGLFLKVNPLIISTVTSLIIFMIVYAFIAFIRSRRP